MNLARGIKRDACYVSAGRTWDGCCIRSWMWARRDLVTRQIRDGLSIADRIVPSAVQGPADLALRIPCIGVESFNAVVAARGLREIASSLLRGIPLPLIVFFSPSAIDHRLSLLARFLRKRCFNGQILEDLQRKLQSADRPGE